MAFLEEQRLLILEEVEGQQQTLYEHDAQLSAPGRLRGFSVLELHRLGVLERWELA